MYLSYFKKKSTNSFWILIKEIIYCFKFLINKMKLKLTTVELIVIILYFIAHKYMHIFQFLDRKSPLL